MANDNYYIFQQLFEGSSYPGYFVIDSKNNLLIENISDPTPYQDGTEYDSDFVYVNGVKYEITSSYHDKNILKFNDESLEINYDYVLTRSEEMRKIDSIIGPYKRELRTTLISFENKRLYVILESEFGMFGAGELKPVVFEYIIESDTFEYIGCTNRMGISPYIFGIVPYEENKQ